MAGLLNLRAKLALAHTSMSQRQIAAVTGVSPRTVGRWLREGTSEGVKKIPREARDLVNIVFDIHKDLARDAARRFEIPFTPDFPVYATRKPLQQIDRATGRPMLGDRIFIENAQFFDSQMRQIAILDMALTGKMVTATVGSNLNLLRYYQESLAHRLDEQRRSRKSGKATPREIRRAMQDSFESTFGVSVRDLELQAEIKPVYTKQRVIAPEFDIAKEVQAIEQHIRNKHEPATGEPGTVVGHTIIVQMKRESTNEANARIAARQAAKNQRKRRKT